MTGIVAGLLMPQLSGTFLAISVVFLFTLFLAWKGRKVRMPPLVLFFILGYWSLQSWTAPSLSANHVSRFIDDNPWHIIGTLDGPPQRLPDRMRFTLMVESLTRKQICYPVIGAIRVTVHGNNVDDFGSGERVGCLARLKEIRNFNNPGGFDYRRYMTFRGICASAFVSNGNLLIKMHAAKTSRFRQALERLRQSVSSLVERASVQEAGGVLKALIVGDRSEISPETREVFNRIGIAHLLAISGLHIGMVATLAFFAFRFLMARSQRVLLAAWATRGAALLSVFPVLFYGFLAGMSPATS
jgi:competence protein ComEC